MCYTKTMATSVPTLPSLQKPVFLLNIKKQSNCSKKKKSSTRTSCSKRKWTTTTVPTALPTCLESWSRLARFLGSSLKKSTNCSLSLTVFYNKTAKNSNRPLFTRAFSQPHFLNSIQQNKHKYSRKRFYFDFNVNRQLNRYSR